MWTIDIIQLVFHIFVGSSRNYSPDMQQWIVARGQTEDDSAPGRPQHRGATVLTAVPKRHETVIYKITKPM